MNETNGIELVALVESETAVVVGLLTPDVEA